MQTIPAMGAISFGSGKSETYRLYHQHVSVYETEVKSRAHLSNYHYTAHLEDDAGNRFRLHVFFDPLDRVKHIELSQMGEESFDVIATDDLLNMQFLEHAIAVTTPILVPLREAHYTRMAELEVALENLYQETDALSRDLPESKAAYLVKSEEAMSVLADLQVMHDGHASYQAQGNLMRKSQAWVRKLSDEALRETSKRKASKTQLPREDEGKGKKNKDLSSMDSAKPLQNNGSDEHSSPQKEADKNNAGKSRETAVGYQEKVRRRKVDRVELALDKLDELASRCDEKRIDPENIEQVVSYDDKLSELVQAVELSDHAVDLRTNLQLEAHQRRASHIAKSLLERLLVTGRTGDAKPLAHHLAGSLARKMTEFALKMDKAELLEFLLIHSSLPLNTFTIKEDTKRLSAVRYAYLKNLFGCLEVLIAQGASIMVPLEDGLPLAYHMYIDSECVHLLQKCGSATFENPVFLRNLSNTLEAFLTTRLDFPSDERHHIESLIAGFRATRRAYNDPIFKKNALQIERSNALQKKIKDKVDGEILAALNRDPRFNNNKRVLTELSRELARCLPENEQRALFSNSTSLLSDANKNLEHFGIVKGIAVEDFIAYQEKVIEQFKGRIDLAVWQKEMRKELARARVTSHIKQVKKMAVREKELIAECRRHDEAVSDIQDSITRKSAHKTFIELQNTLMEFTAEFNDLNEQLALLSHEISACQNLQERLSSDVTPSSSTTYEGSTARSTDDSSQEESNDSVHGRFKRTSEASSSEAVSGVSDDMLTMDETPVSKESGDSDPNLVADLNELSTRVDDILRFFQRHFPQQGVSNSNEPEAGSESEQSVKPSKFPA